MPFPRKGGGKGGDGSGGKGDPGQPRLGWLMRTSISKLGQDFICCGAGTCSEVCLLIRWWLRRGRNRDQQTQVGVGWLPSFGFPTFSELCRLLHLLGILRFRLARDAGIGVLIPRCGVETAFSKWFQVFAAIFLHFMLLPRTRKPLWKSL